MHRLGVGLAGALWLATTLIRAQTPPADTGPALARIDYVSQIQPILEQYCTECHDGETRKGGLSVASLADLLEGGRSGPLIRPGASTASLFMDRVTGAVEPSMPKGEDPLPAATLDLLRRWIDEGARATPTAPPAPQPWEAPLTLTRVDVPRRIWREWQRPVDRLTADYLVRVAAERTAPPLVSDAAFARRAYLDAWGLLPPPADLRAFLEDRRPDKRERLVERLLDDRDAYAQHWMSFWNDLLRNEDGVSYFAERDGRTSITPWLYESLRRNEPYDRFVRALLNPVRADDPTGFLIGVNWRGETSAAVTPWMQASQNTAQVFLGVNMKCNACHDSFVNRWKLKDAYGLAAYFAPDARLQLFRCDVARDEHTGPQFPFPQLHVTPRSDRLEDRREAAALSFTHARNGRLARTLVNRIWERLLGRGLVATADEMDLRPWSPALLDWLARDFVAHDYDVRRLTATIMTSRAYQLASVPRTAEPSARDYVFRGPEVRRLTAEQFADAIGTLTGEWSVAPAPPRPSPTPARPAVVPTAAGRSAPARTDSDSPTSGVYAREWRAPSSALTRALGRPVRDQVTSTRADDATTPQALELVNGARLTEWIERGARRLTGDLPPDTLSRYTAPIAGRAPRARAFDIDVAAATSIWLVVRDTGSNVPERVRPVWVDPVLVDAAGVETRLSALTPATGTATASARGLLHVVAPSTLRYDIGGRGFVRLRGSVDVDNPRSEIGATLNPALRFFVFDAEPDPDRLLPPAGSPPLLSPVATTDADVLIDRLFWQAIGRAPAEAERRLARAVVIDPATPGRLSSAGVADLIWALLMKPEFQLIF